jgi:tetratricopeptide (TPR) repeat protein
VFNGQGEYQDSLAQARSALRLSRVSGHRRGLAASLQVLGQCHAELGNLRQTLVACRGALRILKEIEQDSPSQDTKHAAALTWDTMGFALQRAGRDAEAADSYEHALELYREVDSGHDRVATLERLGEVRLRAGRTDRARTAWSEALAILEGLEDPEAARLRTKLAGLK